MSRWCIPLRNLTPGPGVGIKATQTDYLSIQAGLDRVAGRVGRIAAQPEGVGAWRGEVDGIGNHRAGGQRYARIKPN